MSLKENAHIYVFESLFKSIEANAVEHKAFDSFAVKAHLIVRMKLTIFIFDCLKGSVNYFQFLQFSELDCFHGIEFIFELIFFFLHLLL